jgi:signal transduction histidine kinase
MPVNRPLQVLLVQNPDDTALVLEQLQKPGSRTIISETVATVKAFREALEKNNWDITIARFDSQVTIAQLCYTELLHILREYHLNIPLILVVEEITSTEAIRAIKAGVNDIVLITELARLNESVEYELHAVQSQAELNQNKQELRELQQGISKRIQAEAILTEQNQIQAQLQQLASNIPGVIYQFLLTPEGTYSFQFLSPSCYEIYELTPAQIQENPKRILEIVHRSERSHLALSVTRSAVTLQPWEWEGRINTPSGQEKWLKGAARPIRQPNGNILWDGLIMDITESKLTQTALCDSEAQLRQKATELEQTLRKLHSTQMQLIQTEKMSSLGQLVAGIAHEINNPVNFIYNNLNFATEYSQNILNLLELYQQHYPNPPLEIQSQIQEIELDFVKEDLPKILSSMQMGTDRICEIILGLRNFSRIDQKTAQTVDIHQVIDSVILILQHRLRQIGDNPGIEIIKEYQQLPLIKCYPGQLNQVFMNLIANAIDAVEEGVGSRELRVGEDEGEEVVRTVSFPNPYSLHPTPSIRIQTQLSNNQSCVLICIADNGLGISPEKQQQIFNTFFTTKPVDKGTGLGLSISQQIIVEKHCGRLWCTSELGQGTEFWIEIPIEGDI